MLDTRSDIVFAVSVISWYTSNLTDVHWKAVKRIFWYLQETLNLELVYQESLITLKDYSDADWVSDYNSQRSISDFIFNMSSEVINWFSKQQLTVTLFTCKTEYIDQTQITKKVI